MDGIAHGDGQGPASRGWAAALKDPDLRGLVAPTAASHSTARAANRASPSGRHRPETVVRLVSIRRRGGRVPPARRPTCGRCSISSVTRIDDRGSERIRLTPTKLCSATYGTPDPSPVPRIPASRRFANTVAEWSEQTGRLHGARRQDHDVPNGHLILPHQSACGVENRSPNPALARRQRIGATRESGPGAVT